jgi:glucosamine--fructose-6-phosphate aminotransferase (isomerizing)
VKGTYAIAVIMSGQDRIIASRKENPLVIGLGVGENFIASDVTALLDYTNKVLYLMDDETVELTAKKADIYDANGNRVDRRPELVTWTAEDAQKGGFEHFMLKEIYETPEAMNNTLLGNLEGIETGEILPDLSFNSIKLVACGTSYHAAMIGKYILETWTKLPVSVEFGSEFRYGAITKEQPLVILISQSGETADTLAAAREAKKRGCRTLAVSNVVGSTITREVNEVLYTRAGPEIGVAATKTFVAQLAALYMIALRIAYGKRTMDIDSLRTHKKQLGMLPKVIREVLSTADQIEATADLLADANHVFYLGRNINYPVMLEGALKLKEISYIHAEGYAAGELKHGPLALIDASTPVVAACVRDHTYGKMLSNISEVQARDSPVIAVGTEGDRDLESIANHVIFVPEVPPIFSPFPITVALQLLAYHTARKKGCPIDKPRNLAKSVTVE